MSPAKTIGNASGFIPMSCFPRNASGPMATIFREVAFRMNSSIGRPWLICQTANGTNNNSATPPATQGQHVHQLLNDETRQAGSWRVVWNGRDGVVGTVPSGMYFYRLTTPIGSFTKRITLMK